MRFQLIRFYHRHEIIHLLKHYDRDLGIIGCPSPTPHRVAWDARCVLMWLGSSSMIATNFQGKVTQVFGYLSIGTRASCQRLGNGYLHRGRRRERPKHRRVQLPYLRGGAMIRTWVLWGAKVPHRVVWDACRTIKVAWYFPLVSNSILVTVENLNNYHTTLGL